jgi:hypothetical protein
MYRDIFYVYNEKHAKHRDKCCGPNSKVFKVKSGGTYNSQFSNEFLGESFNHQVYWTAITLVSISAAIEVRVEVLNNNRTKILEKTAN